MTDFHSLQQQYDLEYTPVLREALEYAIRLHDGQFRVSGEPYIHHIFRAVTILQSVDAPESTHIAAALHDTVEDTEILIDELAKRFGNQAGFMVFALTKTEIYKDKLERTESDKTKILNLYATRVHLGIIAEPLIMFVKAADQIDNLRTLSAMPLHKQHAKLHQVRDVFLPMYLSSEHLLQDFHLDSYYQLINLLQHEITQQHQHLNDEK